MASLGGASESVAVVVGAGELGSATAALDELPAGIRREVGDTTDQAVAKTLINRIAGQVCPPEVLVDSIGGFLLGEAGPTAGMARTASARRPSATSFGSSILSCARTVSGPRNFSTPAIPRI
jgi:hypothetical protein